MCNLSMMELFIVVSIVTIKQQQRATFAHMCNLSMKELNILVNIVTIKQLQKGNLKKHVKSAHDDYKSTTKKTMMKLNIIVTKANARNTFWHEYKIHCQWTLYFIHN